MYPAGAQIGTTVEVTLAGAFPTWPVNVWTSDPKIVGTASKEKGKISLKIPADSSPKPLWIRIHDAEGASAPRPFLLGRLFETMEVEPNDLYVKAQTITANTVINGKFNKSGDVDHYRRALKKGETLVVSLVSNEVIHSPTDSVLQLLDSRGFVVAQNHDTRGLDPQISFTAAKDDEYIVRVLSFPAQPDSTIGLYGNDAAIYRLTMTTGPFADHTIPLAVTLKNPTTIRVQGWNIPDSFGDLKVENNHEAAWIDHSKLTEILPVHLADEPKIVDPSGVLKPPFQLTNQILKKGELHTYKISVQKGKPLQISTSSRIWNLMVTPMLTLRDSKNKIVSKAAPPDVNLDCEIRYTPPLDETLSLEIRDQFGYASSRSTYLLRVREPKPDFELKSTSDRIGVKAGQSTTISLAVNSLNGFNEKLTIDHVELPEGISAAVVAQPKEKEDNKVVNLELKASPTAKSGAFQLRMRSARGDQIVQPAFAIVPEFTLRPVKTNHFWIHVSKESSPVPKK